MPRSPTHPTQAKLTQATPARLEAFSDGVIAVIITIMVLELKVPPHDGMAGLMAVLPTIGLYALSFAFVGVYWVNHHHLVNRTEQADERTLYANLFFLFWLSLLPFFTEYVADKKMNSFSVLLYVVSMILTGGSFGLLRIVIGRHLRETGKLQREDAAAERKHGISLLMYLVAAACSLRYPRIALAIVGLVTAVWIVPSAKVNPIEPCADGHAAERDGIGGVETGTAQLAHSEPAAGSLESRT
jgi:uncharacterized membrane protein